MQFQHNPSLLTAHHFALFCADIALARYWHATAGVNDCRIC